jgi:ubiquinone/menaquinone biosynthesis C-methylase UbiE
MLYQRQISKRQYSGNEEEMAVENVVHVNEHGLQLNGTDWLLVHHQCKLQEREQMVHDLALPAGSFVVDAGCGPGLWSLLLAQCVGHAGHILGVDINRQALAIAQMRKAGSHYQQQIEYRCSPFEQLPILQGTADIIFSANVSQYLPDPVRTFTSIGPYLKRGGRLIIKDIDYGSIVCPFIRPTVLRDVLLARKRWEQERIRHGYAFEDSWVGSKLASYLREAGYKDVEEKTYRIIRSAPLSQEFRLYLQGIAEWFVSEDAPYLDSDSISEWLQCFFDEHHAVFNRSDFWYEETEYVVSGTWQPTFHLSLIDLNEHSLTNIDKQ